MLVAAGRFLLGAFIELMQLTLLFAASFMGVNVALGNIRLPDSVPPPSLAAFAFLAVYSLMVWWPARDLVEGWLGLLARRLPDRYTNRAENLGRALLALAYAALILALPAGGRTFEGHAFANAYIVIAVVVFAIGGAIPRLWFGFRADAWDKPEAIPQLLQEAGHRGALFVIAIFLGIGLGFTAGYTVASRRVAQPVELHGKLCRRDTKQCPATRTLDVPVHGDAVAIKSLLEGTDDMCTITAGGVSIWLNRTLPVVNGHVQLAVSLPANHDRCGYNIHARPAKAAP